MNKGRKPGVLYVVATPIGNLDDITPRAVQILADVDLIAAEDTRHSRRLTGHLGIATPMLALHDFNEKARSGAVLDKLETGSSIALISDAGTPLISDPGYHLVHEARLRGIEVVPIPGACALVAALSVAGLPTDRFCFEGFLPAKQGNRRRALDEIQYESRTLVFYESPHRILDCLRDMADILGASRRCVVARELTKQFETLYDGSIGQHLETLASHEDHQRGEFVVMVQGSGIVRQGNEVDARQLLQALIPELPLKKAAAITANVTGLSKNELYSLGLELKEGVVHGDEGAGKS